MAHVLRYIILYTNFDGEIKLSLTNRFSTDDPTQLCQGTPLLEQLILKHIQMVMGYILRHENHFRTVMEQQIRVGSAGKIQASKKQLDRDEKRISELKRPFVKIYEDNASGRLSDERFDMLSQNYKAEQKQLETEVVSLRQEIEVQERQNENIKKFIQKTHIGVTEVTLPLENTGFSGFCQILFYDHLLKGGPSIYPAPQYEL